MKICSTCGVEKPETEFYPHPNTKDKLRKVCKVCVCARSSKWAKDNPEKHNAKNARWAKTNPEKHSAAIRAWGKANPERLRELNRRSQKTHPETARAWRRANPDKVKATRQRYQGLNINKCRAATADWAKRNPEKQKARSQRWYANNLAWSAAKASWRLAQKLQATPAWANQGYIEDVYRKAAIFTKRDGTPWHVDHIIPLKSKLVCGLHCEDNFQVLSGTANMTKGNRSWPDMPGAL